MADGQRDATDSFRLFLEHDPTQTTNWNTSRKAIQLRLTEHSGRSPVPHRTTHVRCSVWY